MKEEEKNMKLHKTLLILAAMILGSSATTSLYAKPTSHCLSQVTSHKRPSCTMNGSSNACFDYIYLTKPFNCYTVLELIQSLCKPEFDFPSCNKPGTNKPGMGKPDFECPDLETPDVDAPDMETPDMEAPDMETPDVDVPDMETPDVDVPDMETPDVDVPDMETPDTDVPDAEAPEVEVPGTGTPEVEVPGTETPEVEVSSQVAFENKVLELVNIERAKQGLKALAMDESVRKVARVKSTDMAKNKYFSHTSPTYGSPFDMLKSFGISYKSAGENIAQGYQTPQAVVTGWMNSPGHRANILNASYTHIGIGYEANGNYWTQLFISK